MRITRYTLIAILLCLFVMVSCVEINPAFNRENIKGTWILDMKDGEPIPVREYKIYTFEAGIRLILEGLMNVGEEGYMWTNPQMVNILIYGVTCSVLDMRGTVSGFDDIPDARTIKQKYEIIEHKDSLLIIRPTVSLVEDIPLPLDYTEATMRKLSNQYSATDSLKGVWEVQSKGGEALNDFRIDFLNNGILDFYTKQPDASWKILHDGTEDYYSAYPNLLVTTVRDNSIFETGKKWDVLFFKIVSLSPLSKEMILSTKEDDVDVEYTFKKVVEENQDEGNEAF